MPVEVETLDVDEENIDVHERKAQYLMEETQMTSIEEELRPSEAKLLPDNRDLYESDEEQETSANRMLGEHDTPPRMIELTALTPTKNASPVKDIADMTHNELVERYKQFKRSSEQYERLYNEYLEKFILSER